MCCNLWGGRTCLLGVWGVEAHDLSPRMGAHRWALVLCSLCHPFRHHGLWDLTLDTELLQYLRDGVLPTD